MKKNIILSLILLISAVSISSCSEFHRGTTDTTDMGNQADTVDEKQDDSVGTDNAGATDEGLSLGDGEQKSGNDQKNQSSENGGGDADNEEDNNNSGKSLLDDELTSILNAMYANTEFGDWPTLIDSEITKDNMDYFFGTEDFEFDKGVSREPFVSSVAHSVSIIRLKNADDAPFVVEKIRENVDNQKWIFVEVERDKIIVDSKNDIVVLIMTNEHGEELKESFDKLDI